MPSICGQDEQVNLLRRSSINRLQRFAKTGGRASGADPEPPGCLPRSCQGVLVQIQGAADETNIHPSDQSMSTTCSAMDMNLATLQKFLCIWQTMSMTHYCSHHLLLLVGGHTCEPVNLSVLSHVDHAILLFAEGITR